MEYNSFFGLSQVWASLIWEENTSTAKHRKTSYQLICRDFSTINSTTCSQKPSYKILPSLKLTGSLPLNIPNGWEFFMTFPCCDWAVRPGHAQPPHLSVPCVVGNDWCLHQPFFVSKSRIKDNSWDATVTIAQDRLCEQKTLWDARSKETIFNL